MYFKLLACNVFFRELAHLTARVPAIVDVSFTDKGEHERPEVLRGLIQAQIDQAAESGRAYDAVLLAYGLCGNACAGLEARSAPLVIPRAHDCCTILLGSKDSFKRHFGDNPSRRFSSAGWLERGSDLSRSFELGRALGLGKSMTEFAALYGEENARFIMETINQARAIGAEEEIIYIEIAETAHLGWAEVCRRRAEVDGKRLKVIDGSLRLLEGLLKGSWPPEDYLVIHPGSRLEAVYDWDEVVRAVKTSSLKPEAECG